MCFLNYLTFQDVSGINVTVTPTAASSKIHVEFCLGKVHHSGNSTGVRFTRSVAGATATAIKLGDADGNRSRLTTNIIGGGQIYKLALEANLVNKIYLTKVHHTFDGDTFFSKLGNDWKEVGRIDCKADEKHAHDYSFLTFEKIN